MRCWKKTDGTEVTVNPAMVTINGSENSGTPATASYSVEFMMRPSIEVRSNDALLGSAVIDKIENSLGDVVTVSAKGRTADGLYGYEVRNRHSRLRTGLMPTGMWYRRRPNILSPLKKMMC